MGSNHPDLPGPKRGPNLLSNLIWHDRTEASARYFSNCRCSRSAWLSSLMIWRNLTRWPPFHAFRDALALPSGVLGPVDLVQGAQDLTDSLCRSLRAVLRPFMLGLQ